MNSKDVYNIFIDFFGEDYVDFQSSDCDYILVYYPEVTISNENDDSMLLRDLYVEVALTHGGSYLSFKLNRASFTTMELIVDYSHSHISGISDYDRYKFLSPCLGSGPIIQTTASLCSNPDEDLWRLFCIELDKYVHVESLLGGPYRRMATVKSDKRYTSPYSSDLSVKTDSDLIDLFLQTHLKFYKFEYTYYNGNYWIAMPYHKLVLTVSNEFIKWYNDVLPKELKEHFGDILNIIEKVEVRNGIIYREKNDYFRSRTQTEINRLIGQKLCTFKGNTIRLKEIKETEQYEEFTMVNAFVFKPAYFSYLINKILEQLNFAYGNYQFNSKIL